MAKTNDTTLFPVGTPAASDLLFGTDVSDTSISPDGKVANFTVGSLFAVSATSGSSKVPKEGLGGLCIGAVGGKSVSSAAIVDLDAAEELTLVGSFNTNVPSTGVCSLTCAFSDDNGTTYGSEVTLYSISFGSDGGSLAGSLTLTQNLVTGVLRASSSVSNLAFVDSPVLNTTLTVPTACNAYRLSISPAGQLVANVYVTGGRT